MSTGVGTESEAQSAGNGERVVQVSQVVQAPVGHVWEVLVSRDGAVALLGDGAVLGAKGDSYHCADGSCGFVRSYHPLEQLRVSWHATPDSPPSIVELDLRADGDATLLELRHDRVWDDAQAAELERRWSASLAALAAKAATG